MCPTPPGSAGGVVQMRKVKRGLGVLCDAAGEAKGLLSAHHGTEGGAGDLTLSVVEDVHDVCYAKACRVRQSHVIGR